MDWGLLDASAAGEGVASLSDESWKDSAMRAARRLRVEFQRFLMALSVRPSRKVAMRAHLLPCCL